MPLSCDALTGITTLQEVYDKYMNVLEKRETVETNDHVTIKIQFTNIFTNILR